MTLPPSTLLIFINFSNNSKSYFNLHILVHPFEIKQKQNTWLTNMEYINLYTKISVQMFHSLTPK